MGHLTCWRAGWRVSLWLGLTPLAAAPPASGQIVPWFDINPSRSNTEADDPNGELQPGCDLGASPDVLAVGCVGCFST
jgi:hypothetical protein